MGKIILRMCKNGYNYIAIVCVTCRNILKMGVQVGTMKSLGRAPILLRIISFPFLKLESAKK